MSAEIIEKVHTILPGFELSLLSQGAEALVFASKQHPYAPGDVQINNLENDTEYIVKYRPRKPYRHEQLDLQITKSRTAGEARLLYKLMTLNIRAPRLIALDASNGIIWMECVGYRLANGDFSNVKNWLWMVEGGGDGDAGAPPHARTKAVMESVGKAVAEVHRHGIIHGDLTTSNVVLTAEDQATVALIDFGLSQHSALPEDQAVDLYVLERALLSTHPEHAVQYNQWLLDGYRAGYAHNTKAVVEIERRLGQVRMRGRKRSLLG